MRRLPEVVQSRKRRVRPPSLSFVSVSAAVLGLCAVLLAVGSPSAAGKVTMSRGVEVAGRIVFVRASQSKPGVERIWVMNADGGGQALLSTGSHDEFADPVWSPDGQRIAFTNWLGGGIWVMNPDGSGQRSLTHGHDAAPAWSPDGRRIAFCRGGSNGHPAGVFVVNADGTNPVSLSSRKPAAVTRAAGQCAAPAWSPDGRQIAYLVSSGPAGGAIWLMNSDGTGKRRLIANASALTGRPAWSPDGRSLAFASSRGGQSDIYVVDVSSGRLRNVTRNKAADGMPAWSPDGHQLAFASSRDQGTMDIYLMNLDTQRVIRLTTDPDDDTEPAWAPASP